MSVYGFATQMGGAAIVSVLVFFSNDNAFGMSVLMFSLSLVILLALVGWTMRQKAVEET